MAYPTQLPGDLVVPGDIRVSGIVSPALARVSILAASSLQKFPIPLTSFRVWDNMAALLPTAGATDDLGIIEGTFGTATPTLQTEDLKALGATNNRARVLVQLPWEYIAGNPVTLRFKAGMITTVADTTAVLDCEVYKLQGDPDDAIGSDLYTGSAVTMNSLVFADIDFSLTASSLSPGDIFDVRISTTITDAATVTAVIGGISSAKLLCDVR